MTDTTTNDMPTAPTEPFSANPTAWRQWESAVAQQFTAKEAAASGKPAVSTPSASINPAQAAQFEQDLASARRQQLGAPVERAIQSKIDAIYRGEAVDVAKAQAEIANLIDEGAGVSAEVKAAAEVFSPKIAADGSARGGDFPKELTANFVLPADESFVAEDTIRMLHAAARAGFTQADVDRYLAAT